jgi:hypothetical protein
MDRTEPIVEVIGRLRRAGWSCGDVAFHTDGGGTRWVVSSTNGFDRVQGRGLTAAEAWRVAAEQAWRLGGSGHGGG